MSSERYITRSVKARIEKDMIDALAQIGGKVVVKMRGMLIVEFSHKVEKSNIFFMEIIPFKIVENKLKIIYSDTPKYARSACFKTRHHDNKDLLQKIEDFLKIYKY